MTGECVTCDAMGTIERHHPAGRKNDPRFVVEVCVPCHRILTDWQRAIGMPLRRGASSDGDRMRASAVGALDVWQLWMYRHFDPSNPFFYVPRLVARCLALSADEEMGCHAWTVDPQIALSAVVQHDQ